MTVYFATDHAGFELKNILLAFVRDELGLEVVDCGAYEFNKADDYTDWIKKAAQAVSEDGVTRKAVILGGSGQGEAILANKYKGVRTAVYYGAPKKRQVDADGVELDIVTSVRALNDANILSLGARFLDEHEAKEAVRVFLATDFSNEERHQRRIEAIES